MSKKELLKSQFLKGKVSRRDFVAGMAAFGVGSVAAAHLADELIAKAGAQEPQRGGRMRVATLDTAPTDVPDGATTFSYNGITMAEAIYEKLVRLDEKEGIKPFLATEWDHNDDATEWTVRLRKDVEFHNGKTLGPEDVIYTVNRVKDPETASPGAAFLEHMEEAAADGSDGVRFKLSRTDPDFISVFLTAQLPIIPDGMTDFSTAESNAGTGPWAISELDLGITMVAKRHANYWQEGKPYLDEIEIFGIPDNNARFNALVAGEVEMIESLDTGFVGEVDGSTDVELVTTASAGHASYPMWAPNPPFDNVDVRKALKHAVDRQKYIDLAFNGLARAGNDQPVPPFDPFYCADNPGLETDPDKVKYYLKQAGHENTVFELTASDASYGGVNAAAALTEILRENGVNAELNRVPADGYWTVAWMQVPWCASSWSGRPTAGQILSQGYTSGSEWNETGWHNEEFEKAVNAAAGETNTDKRKEIYCDVQRMLTQDGATIIPGFINLTDAKTVKLHGITPNPLRWMGGMLWADAWLESGEA